MKISKHTVPLKLNQFSIKSLKLFLSFKVESIFNEESQIISKFWKNKVE